MTKASGRFYAARWVEGEIEANIWSYDNTREQAMQHVRDMLEEGEYHEELTDDQVARAHAAVLAAQRKAREQA